MLNASQKQELREFVRQLNDGAREAMLRFPPGCRVKCSCFSGRTMMVGGYDEHGAIGLVPVGTPHGDIETLRQYHTQDSLTFVGFELVTVTDVKEAIEDA